MIFRHFALHGLSFAILQSCRALADFGGKNQPVKISPPADSEIFHAVIRLAVGKLIWNVMGNVFHSYHPLCHSKHRCDQ